MCNPVKIKIYMQVENYRKRFSFEQPIAYGKISKLLREMVVEVEDILR